MNNEVDSEGLINFLCVGDSTKSSALFAVPKCDREVDSWHQLREIFGDEANVRAAFAIASHVVEFIDDFSRTMKLPKRPNVHTYLSSIAKWCICRTPPTPNIPRIDPRHLRYRLEPWRTLPAHAELMVAHMITRNFPGKHILWTVAHEAKAIMIQAGDTAQRLFDTDPYVYAPPEHLRKLFGFSDIMPTEFSVNHTLIFTPLHQRIRDDLLAWCSGTADPVEAYLNGHSKA